MKILLQGYYGRGNWGDDLLMLITFRLLRSIFSDACIDILTADRPHPYIHGILDEPVSLLSHGAHGHYDLIVHGGGGVFFDYNHYPLHRRWREQLIGCLGYSHYLQITQKLRRLCGKARTSSNNRIAMGVGVGTFSHGSPAFLNALSAMQQMQAVWLRDAESKKNLQRFESIFSAHVVDGSDMVFLHEHWQPRPQTSEKHAETLPRLGVILRNSYLKPEHYSQISDVLSQLKQTYTLSVFFLEQEEDATLASSLAKFSPTIWQPDCMPIAEFAALLAQQEVILTSRAHGAICAACLGIPSVILEIEPKLRRIHEMLPRSSLLCDPLAYTQWSGAIDQARQIHAADIAADVAYNRTQSLAAWEEISALLSS